MLEDKVTFNKRMLTYSSRLVVVKPLLIRGGLDNYGIPGLPKHINVCLALLLIMLLVIEADPGGAKVKVERHDDLHSIDKEEGCVVG